MALEGHGGQHGAALRGHLLLAPICLHGDPTVPSSPCPGLCLTLIQRTALLPRLRRPRPSLAASELSPPRTRECSRSTVPSEAHPSPGKRAPDSSACHCTIWASGRRKLRPSCLSLTHEWSLSPSEEKDKLNLSR